MRTSVQTFLLVAAVTAGGCGEGPRSEPAPLDRFTFPTGLAIVPAPLAPGGRALLVVSSNFDLRYGQNDGGSVLAVDPDASDGDRLAVLGAARIASFGGDVAVASADPLPVPAGVAPPPATCQGQTGPSQVVVASRTDNALYKLDLDAAAALSCGPSCRVPLASGVADPFGVQVVCRPGGERVAYVGHLRAPDLKGWLSRVDLATGATSLVPFGDAPTGSFAYDAARERLFVTGRFAQLDQSPLRWLDLFSGAPFSTANLAPAIRGADQRSMALSTDGTRAYVAIHLFDRDTARALGRPFELAGALAILDVRPGGDGEPTATLLQMVPLALGPNQVLVLPRGDGRRDLVAITSSEEGALTIYDDQAGSVATVLATDANGERLFGRQPFGLAAEFIAPKQHRLYVGSFDRGYIRTVLVDVDQPALAAVGKKFGREVP